MDDVFMYRRFSIGHKILENQKRMERVSMMNLYLTEPEMIVNANDSFFNKYTFGNLDYTQAKNIVREIDKVELTEDFKIKSHFTSGELDLSKLSTGCKTVLNVVTYPNKVFNVIECGLNALNVMYKISIGNFLSCFHSIYRL